MNDDVDHYFQTKKGIRQGDPLSPIMFNLVADMLAILIECAKQDMEIEGGTPTFGGWRPLDPPIRRRYNSLYGS